MKILYCPVLALAVFSLSACIYTGAEFNATHSDPAAQAIASAHTKNALEITVTEEDVLDRPYRILGEVSAYGRAINLGDVNPTHDDINEALRKEAAERGADAVIKVHYKVEPTDFSNRGKLSAIGTAIVFVK